MRMIDRQTQLTIIKTELISARIKYNLAVCRHFLLTHFLIQTFLLIVVPLNLLSVFITMDYSALAYLNVSYIFLWLLNMLLIWFSRIKFHYIKKNKALKINTLSYLVDKN